MNTTARINEGMKAILDYPDISFIEGYTINRLEEDMISWFKNKKKELTGEDVILGKADDRRIILQTGAYYIFQAYMYIDHAGKMGLLKYSQGEYLENLGAMKHVTREEPKSATTTIRFRMNEERSAVVGIPKGTRLTAGDQVYFATDEYCEISLGQLWVDVGATCTVAGSIGNQYDIGDIKTIVDPVPYIDGGQNITKPENGADLESDDPSYRERIYIAPASYSTAGTEDSYEYFIRQYNPGISDIRITVPENCVVRIQYLLQDGEVPGEESMKGLLEYISEKERKVLCDKLEVVAPDQVSYDLNVKYYINQSDKNRADMIQKNVEAAVEEYLLWQRNRMGRDINPDMLRKLMVSAGAKRIEVISPEFTVIGPGAVAVMATKTIVYGGLEND